MLDWSVEAKMEDVAILLEMAGAKPPRYGRGKWTCPDCQKPTLGVNLQKAVFNCFHEGCPFHGGPVFLRKRLGIRRDWVPADEYRRQRQQRERAEDAARRLYEAVHARRTELLDWLRDLARLENAAHDAGMDQEQAWADLALVYRERPEIESELDFLESANAAELAEKLDVLKNAAEKTRHVARGSTAAR
jgi:hypothetical protein